MMKITVFEIATSFIRSSNHSVFLTGKAGTGKTTFLKNIKETVLKNTVVVAPTGVAAINAGGVTIHSFFNLPFTPFIPNDKRQYGNTTTNDKHNLIGKLRLNNEKKELMQTLDLLIIDEISMVRCDLLDAIDTVLRFVRNQPSRVFGGVQVLYIGDMYQLPPVVRQDEWQMLGKYYDNPFFFSSRAILEQPPVYIELEKVYRQKDLSFVELLNKVRNNLMDDEGYRLLHSRHLPNFKPGENENYITLTTHNNSADTINASALNELKTVLHSFAAVIEGIFPENSYPADQTLHLKEGARVMFLKNDTEKIRRYYNGKIGIISKIEGDKVWVECPQDGVSSLIEVKKEAWQNIRYSLNAKKHQVEEETLGSFTQYPLRLAWAITIHKSQGLTFDKIIVDAGKAFAPGQVYVALSRCTSLSGLILKSEISYRSLQSDERVLQFASAQQSVSKKEALLLRAQKEYQQGLIRQLFDFSKISKRLDILIKWNTDNSFFTAVVGNWLKEIKVLVENFSGHTKKFEAVLENFFQEEVLPENNSPLQQRVKKAAQWFIAELEKTSNELSKSPAITDNRQNAQEYTIQLKGLYDEILFQKHLLEALEKNDFSVSLYHEQKNTYRSATFKANAYAGASSTIAGNIPHPELFLALKDRRNQLADESGVAVYMICSTDSLEQMAEYMPTSLADLGKISGFGAIKLKQFGATFISIIENFREENGLQEERIDIPYKKKTKTSTTTKRPDTKKESFDLYSAGKTVEEIASIRNLAGSTIEGHLAHYIETGDLQIEKLVDAEKQKKVLSLLSSGITGLTALKQELNDEYSYGELKWIIAADKKNKQLQQ